MKAWRTTGIAAETLLAFVALTSCCVAIIALNYSALDDRFLNIFNGAIASLLTGFVAYRYMLGAGDGLARTGWIIAGVALGVFAVTQFFEGPFEAFEGTLHLEDEDDIALLLVLPLAILVASRAERIGRPAMRLIGLGVAAQIASTAIDLMDGPLARTDALTLRETDILVDVSEFIFLQLYLIGLALGRNPAAEDPTHARSGVSRWLKRQGFTPKRFYYWHVKPIVWRLANPSGTPEAYYASRIRRQIRRGEFHPAIGPTARSVRAPTELLDILQAQGLKPWHTVVDYGCGSFRLGRAVIEHLEPGKYWGLDVLEDFLVMGMDLLDPNLIIEKNPKALVIADDSLARTRAAAPDFVISWHVCSKVPPSRLADYFGKMISLMTPRTLLLVHFPETAHRRRQSRFSWAESRETIAAVIHGIDPSLEIRFAPVTNAVSAGVRQSMVLVRRRP